MACPTHDRSEDKDEALACLESLLIHTKPRSTVVLDISVDAAYALHDDDTAHSAFVARYGGAQLFVKSTKEKLTTRKDTVIKLHY